MIPLCIDQGVGIIPWSPLARGFFAHHGGAMTKRAETDQFAKRLSRRHDEIAIAEAAAKIANGRGVTSTQIACCWILQAAGVTAPIIGATKTQHLKELFEAVEIKLSAEEITALESPYLPHPIIGHEQPQASRMVR